MLTSKPQPKQRGRQKPKHGKMQCPLDLKKLKLGKDGLFCECGWKEE